MDKETFIINGIKFKIGDYVSFEILRNDGVFRTIKDARLNREESYFFLCQNIVQGWDCLNKFGYRYSYAIHSSEFKLFNVKKLNTDCFESILETAFPTR
jgi:hypothetical protein